MRPASSTCPRRAMLVCHWNMITSKELGDIGLDLLCAGPRQLVVPAKVARELNRRATRSGCARSAVGIIVRVTETAHSQQALETGDVVSLPSGLDKLKKRRSGVRRERRSTGHRAA